MQKVITKSGFECLVDKKQMDDMELVDKIAEADAGNPLAVSAVIEKVLGKEQKAKLYNHLRNEDGRVLDSLRNLLCNSSFATLPGGGGMLPHPERLPPQQPVGKRNGLYRTSL